MLRFKPLLKVALLLAVMLSGCAYKGTVDERGYTPTIAPSSGQAPGNKSSVAFIDNSPLENFTVGNALGPFPFNIKIGPALREALVTDLQGSFQTVDTIPTINKSDTDDFYAILARANWQPLPLFDASTELYRLSLRFIIVDRRQDAVVSDYTATAEISMQHSNGATAASAVTMLTMGVLAPVTEQIKNDAWGVEVQNKLKQGIETAANAINQDLQSDQKLQTLVTLGPIDDGTAGLTPTEMTTSPYGKYLDSVVMVQSDTGFGSGFFVSQDGLIVTCRHVVGNHSTMKIKRRDGTNFDGKVIAVDANRDLALIQIPGSGYPALKLRNTGDPLVGSEVIAIGTPEGLSWSVSKGIVAGIRTARTARLVQTDAAISPGSSGGPLIDASTGQVVGVASFVMSGAQVEKLNFAIESDEIETAFSDKLPPQ